MGPQVAPAEMAATDAPAPEDPSAGDRTTAYYSALVAQWFESKRKPDNHIFMMSWATIGGVAAAAIAVEKLTLPIALVGAASLVALSACMVVGVVLHSIDAKYLGALVAQVNGEKVRELIDKTGRQQRRCDLALRLLFLGGMALALVAVALIATPKLQATPPPTKESEGQVGKDDKPKTPPGEPRWDSVDGAEHLQPPKPKPKPPPQPKKED